MIHLTVRFITMVEESKHQFLQSHFSQPADSIENLGSNLFQKCQRLSISFFRNPVQVPNSYIKIWGHTT